MLSVKHQVGKIALDEESGRISWIKEYQLIINQLYYVKIPRSKETKKRKKKKKKELLRGIAAQLNEIYHTQMFQADSLPQLATLATTKHM